MKSLFALVGLLGLVSAHMEMINPPPFRSKDNPYTTDVDFDMTNPLKTDGSNFPCKGYHSLFDTPQGASVATWQPGEVHTLTLSGSALHSGGSCQASLSYDRGGTFHVIKSWIGNCPLHPDWTFTVPWDAPAGEVIFAWSWYNRMGNRELYMNCAHMTIGGANGSALVGRPGMFVANVGNGCETVEGFDVFFPFPGVDVENTSGSSAPPVGNCG